MDKRTAERNHKRGLRAGKVVVFYAAKAKPLATAPEAEEDFDPAPAIEVLQKTLQAADGLKDVLVLMRDKDDVVGIISNLDGPAENLFLLKQCETQLISLSINKPEPTGPRRA
jgi:hypothetical protein